MVQNCEINETSIIQTNSSSSSSPSSQSSPTKKSFSSRLTHLIRRDPTKNSSSKSSNNSSSNPSSKPKKIYQTQMILLNPTDSNYDLVKSLFKGRPLSQSKILGIFELRMPTKLEKRHETYKKKLSRRTGESVQNITHRMFHGTTSNCSPQRFIEELDIDELNYNEEKGEIKKIFSERNFCEKDCGLCGIVQQGNKTKYTRTKSVFRRNRMWFANDPCTSLYYCNGVYNGVVKSMFVVDVIKKAQKGILVVNKEKAALPRFLILFEMSGNPWDVFLD